MTLTTFSALVAMTSMAAGALGAMTGLGGGVVLVPLLTLAFGVNIRYAIGASLISVIATSSGAASSYVRDGFTNIRLGLLLEVATTMGAVIGALIAGHISTGAIAVIFGVVLLYSAFRSIAPDAEPVLDGTRDQLATRLRLDGALPVPGGELPYTVHRIPLGFAVMGLAGTLSGLLGVGSGALKVLAMDRVMRLPFKVSTTTSNFMIGVTAAASAGVYLRRGYINPSLVWPVMLGVLTGALAGARLLQSARVDNLRRTFGVVVAVLAIEMIAGGLRGTL